jgi:hypothetical protein
MRCGVACGLIWASTASSTGGGIVVDVVLQVGGSPQYAGVDDEGVAVGLGGLVVVVAVVDFTGVRECDEAAEVVGRHGWVGGSYVAVIVARRIRPGTSTIEHSSTERDPCSIADGAYHSCPVLMSGRVWS